MVERGKTLFIMLSISSMLVSVVLYSLTNPSRTSRLAGKTNIAPISVALGVGITSKGSQQKFRQGSLILIPTFKELLPSFCNTASPGYRYHFYFAHDIDDTFFIKPPNIDIWKETFQQVTRERCDAFGDITVQLVKCNHSGRPAWAQNDAMMAAYEDGHDFFYRVNDDTIMLDKNWTNTFIKELMNMRPPLVGVVGPTHSGGNTAILTYDFVHRTHINIFGFYYPRAFPWWYADDWITFIYGKIRSKKIKTVKLKHTMSLNRRYSLKTIPRNVISQILNDGRLTIDRYLRNVPHSKLDLQFQQLLDRLPNKTLKLKVSPSAYTTRKKLVLQSPNQTMEQNLSQSLRTRMK